MNRYADELAPPHYATRRNRIAPRRQMNTIKPTSLSEESLTMNGHRGARALCNRQQSRGPGLLLSLAKILFAQTEPATTCCQRRLYDGDQRQLRLLAVGDKEKGRMRKRRQG